MAKIIRSVLIGLFVALVLLVLLRSGTTAFVFAPNLILGYGQIQSYDKAVQRAAPAVVNVYRDLANAPQRIPRLGSGVIMDARGYILTNKHVIDDSTQITVALQDGRVLEAMLIGSDTLTDLAVLKIKANHLPTVFLNPKRSPSVGDVVLAIGNPFNLGQTVTQGIISATGRIHLSPYGIGRQNFLQTDAAINHGYSGGALVNTRGELVGINTLVLLDSQCGNKPPEGISFAIPARLAVDLMHKIIRNGRVIRGYIGFHVSELTTQHNIGVSLGQTHALLVKETDSAGDPQVTLQPEDIVLSVNGQPVVSVLETMAQVSEIQPGAVIPVVVLRGGKKSVLNITVTEHPIH